MESVIEVERCFIRERPCCRLMLDRLFNKTKYTDFLQEGEILIEKNQKVTVENFELTPVKIANRMLTSIYEDNYCNGTYNGSLDNSGSLMVSKKNKRQILEGLKRGQSLCIGQESEVYDVEDPQSNLKSVMMNNKKSV